MSRTWRKLPKEFYNYSRANRKGGAMQSKGPSIERYRPHTNYNVENLPIAIELLDQSVCSVDSFDLYNNVEDVLQILWNASVDLGYDSAYMMPVMHICTEAIAQNSANNICLYDILIGASVFLQKIVNAPMKNNISKYKDIIVPDGSQNKSYMVFARDDRVTGLRTEDHRRGRREAKQYLPDDNQMENIKTGKTRRYINKYGRYHF